MKPFLGRVKPDFDGKVAIFLASLVVLTRIPFRTSMLYNWDSANFALALRQFDVTRHFPHPPGYYYYVNLGRLIDFLVHDANASFVFESVAFSALAVVALYYLGKAMYDRTTGFIAALFLVFSVTFWSFGTVALAYVALAFFSTAAALFAYGIIFERRNKLLHLSLVYTAGGGFRPDLLLFLAPLWLASLRGQWIGRVAAAGALVVAGFLLWFLPTIWLSGGLGEYLATFAAYTSVDVMQRYSVLQNGPSALVTNVKDTASYLFYGLYATAALLALGLIASVFNIGNTARRGRWLNGRHVFLAEWIAPMALFYAWIHVGDPGYAFTMLPALLILAARAVVAFVGLVPKRLQQKGMAGGLVIGAIVGAVVLTNTAIFALHPRLLTLQGIRQTDRSIAGRISYVRENYAPGTVLLVSYDLYRHLLYYLPEHESVWLDVFARGESEKILKPEVERIIIVDERLSGLAKGAEEIDLPYGKLYVLRAGAGKRVVYGSKGIVVE